MNSHQPFDILFYRGNSWVARIIKKVSKSKNYSHCAMFVDNIHLLENSWKNPVVINHFGYRYLEYDVYRFKRELTDVEKKQIMNFLKKRINTPYDWKFIISRAGNFVFGTNVISSEGKYTCDELIYDAFLSVGIELIDKESVLTPESLAHSHLLIKVNE